MVENTKELLYDDGECYNFTTYDDLYDDILAFYDVRHIFWDSQNDYYKFKLLECDYVPTQETFGDEYLFYEYDLIATWSILCLTALMLIVYTIYIFTSCKTVKSKPQYHETGILVLDDNFSESRLAVLTFQWFALFTFFLNALFNFLSYVSFFFHILYL